MRLALQGAFLLSGMRSSVQVLRKAQWRSLQVTWSFLLVVKQQERKWKVVRLSDDASGLFAIAFSQWISGLCRFYVYLSVTMRAMDLSRQNMHAKSLPVVYHVRNLFFSTRARICLTQMLSRWYRSASSKKHLGLSQYIKHVICLLC